MRVRGRTKGGAKGARIERKDSAQTLRVQGEGWGGEDLS